MWNGLWGARQCNLGVVVFGSCGLCECGFRLLHGCYMESFGIVLPLLGAVCFASAVWALGVLGGGLYMLWMCGEWFDQFCYLPIVDLCTSECLGKEVVGFLGWFDGGV